MNAYELCRGLNSIPQTLEEFLISNVKDDWIMNIKCVGEGTKKVAITDYNAFDDPKGVEEYYASLGDRNIDIQDVEYLTDNDGTKYWYKPENKKNAELLKDLQFIKKKQILKLPKGFDREIIRSLLLGYTDVSIILYKLANDQNNDEFLTDNNYLQTVDEYFKIYRPIVATHRKFLSDLGASLFDD